MNKEKIKKVLPTILVLVVAASIVSAAILSYYGRIEGTADVDQAVLLDGLDVNGMPIIGTWDGAMVAGKTVAENHTVENRAEQKATVALQSTYSPDGVGITTKYYEMLGFSDEKTTNNTQPAVVTVEDLGDSITWTVDVNESDPAYANGHAQFGLIVGVGNDILFQIHSNDGTTSEYPHGTHLYSPYDQNLSSPCAWNGWHSGCVNTPVTDLSFVEATGERDLVNNTEGIFTITIKKGKLSSEEFKWVMNVGGNGNEMTSSTFGWTDSDTTNMHTATVGTEITGPFDVQMLSTLPIVVEHAFDIALAPGSYDIATELVPQ